MWITLTRTNSSTTAIELVQSSHVVYAMTSLNLSKKQKITPTIRSRAAEKILDSRIRAEIGQCTCTPANADVIDHCLISYNTVTSWTPRVGGRLMNGQKL